MIVNDLMDKIESTGFKWNGTYFTCGFYRVNYRNSYYNIEKWVGYSYGRPTYRTMYYIYAPDDYSWFSNKVNEEEYNKFISELKKASRDTKLKRLNGYFKCSEEHYSRLHSRN